MSYLLLQGTATALPLADETVQCVVTSPPYWGLRSYAGEQREVWGGDAEHAHEWAVRDEYHNRGDSSAGAKQRSNHGAVTGRGVISDGSCACGAWYGALGLEPTPELYVEHMVAVFREVRPVLRADGTLWLNLGDSYATGAGRVGERPGGGAQGDRWNEHHMPQTPDKKNPGGRVPTFQPNRMPIAGMKPKDLVGIPWMVAFALRADGWYLRSDIIWAKPNPMPESVTDRPTKAHEYLFLLAKSQRYYYDANAIREPLSEWSEQALVSDWTRRTRNPSLDRNDGGEFGNDGVGASYASKVNPAGSNKRTVWTIATQPYAGAHFATFPEALVEPCILAGSSAKACGVCGAPWGRVVEKGEPELRAWSAKGAGQYDDSTGAMRRAGLAEGSTLKHSVPRETTGWRPTCAHDDGTGASVVLDPFNGSGTTGRVAIRHGRSYVGLDISREYLTEQALHRVDPLAGQAHDTRTTGLGQSVLGI